MMRMMMLIEIRWIILSFLIILRYGKTLPRKQYGNAYFPASQGIMIPNINAVMIGDTNGDGIDDVAFPFNKTRIFVLFGSKSRDIDLLKHFEVQNDSQQGYSVIGWDLCEVFPVGDFNGDGLTDYYISDKGNSPKITFYILFGKKDSFDINLDNLQRHDGVLFRSLVRSELEFAPKIVPLGDINSDGISDIMIVEDIVFKEARSYVFYGVKSISSIDLNQTWNGYVISNCDGIFSGRREVGIGDFNGDGFDDFIIPHMPSSSFRIILGGPASARVSFSLLNYSIPFMLTFKADTFHVYSYSMTKAGDINGDGFDDVLICNRHHAYFLLGFPVAVDAATIIDLDQKNNQDKVVQILGEYSDWFISSTYYGDLDGDGFPENLVESSKGTAFLLFGGKKVSSQTPFEIGNLESRGIMLQLTDMRSDFKLSSGGDIDGDGLNDIFLNHPSEKRPYSLFISGRKLREKPLHRRVNTKYATHILATRILAGIGDFNGDGITDILYSSAHSKKISFGIYLGGSSRELVAGPPFTDIQPDLSFELAWNDSLYSRGHLDYSISCIGDFNRDGFEDFLMTILLDQKNYDDLRLIYGRNIGPDSPKVVSLSPLSEEYGISFFIPEKKDSNGRTVTYALHPIGDVNGDLFPDLLITKNSTETYLILGRGQFPSHRNNIKEFLGREGIVLPGSFYRHSPAGDVNNDGFDDILMSTAKESYLFLGSPLLEEDPPSLSSYHLILTVNDTIRITDVSAAGDLNNDQYDDFIFSIGSFSEAKGMLIIVLGGKDVDHLEQIVMTTNNFNIFGGILAWDANQDGFTDIFVSVFDQGYLYFGRANILPVSDLENEGLVVVCPSSDYIQILGDFDNDTLEDISYGEYIFAGKVLIDLPTNISRRSSQIISFSPIPQFHVINNQFTGWYFLGMMMVFLFLFISRCYYQKYPITK